MRHLIITSLNSTFKQNKIRDLKLFLPTRISPSKVPLILDLIWLSDLTVNNCYITAQKVKFSITDFFSKCDQIRKKLRIWSHLLKKSVILCSECYYVLSTLWSFLLIWEIPKNMAKMICQTSRFLRLQRAFASSACWFIPQIV